MSHWGDRALCRYEGHPSDWDEVLDSTVTTPEPRQLRGARWRRAIEVCQRCPVQLECRMDVDPEIDTGIRFGVLLTSQFRQKLIDEERRRVAERKTA